MISIIIPTRNEEKVIEGTLRRLRTGLAGVPHEIIVSDGSSTDATVRLAKNYAQVFEETGGRHTIGWGRNRGAETATGDVLLFLDADVTIPDPKRLVAEIEKRFRGETDLMGITGPVRVLPEMRTLGDRIFFGWLNLYFRVMTNLFRYGMAPGEFMAVRASAFRKLRGFRENLAAAEDLEFFRRLTRSGRTRFVPELGIMHTGRRAHAVGWPRLLWSWVRNWAGVTFGSGPVDKEWTVIR